MLKKAALALLALGLVLLTNFVLTPAQATPRDSEVYIWSFASPASDRLVCKQVITHPGNPVRSRSSEHESFRMHSHSAIVSNEHCADLTKPPSRSGV
jgi:hypothetical protein